MSGIGKSYGTRRVLENLHLAIAPGEFVAVVGRSGGGKSTLLRIAAGLEAADAGSVEITDEAGRPGARGSVRIMFQEARLLPWKTVVDNVRLGLPTGGTAWGKRQALDVLEKVGLADRANEWPGVLSGGQRQRVSLARALLHRPGLLLLDEPLGALDALTRIEMQELIGTLRERSPFSALLVTHDVEEAVTLADRVVLIEDGVVALDLRIELPRPRRRGDAAVAAVEGLILERVLSAVPPVREAPRDVDGSPRATASRQVGG